MGRRNLTCWSCKQPVLVKDIGEERHRYPGAELEYLCRTCQQAKVKEFVKKTRAGMGMPCR